MRRCGGHCPNRGVLTHFAGIPQVGVQPGAKPPKFGTYPCPLSPGPGPPQTVPGHPSPVAIGVLTSLPAPCVPTLPRWPKLGKWCAVTHGCKVPPVPSALDSLRTVFSFMCQTGAEAPLGAVRWVLETPSMGARATPEGWAAAGGAPSQGC